MLDGAGPAEVLSWAGTTFGDRLAIASSMTDAVLAHLTASSAPLAKVLFLDTGYHFAERLGTVRAVTATLPLEVV
ncbi:MAG: phosphoadenylyl-sulfate reductase, partial [Geodermatophilaceae bacterium]|nr:phosphoadenylyl-sulfate reductase [Geodermatophilaceae bacterium]